MKKIILFLPLTVVLAAGCNNPSSQNTNLQPNQPYVQSSPTSTPAGTSGYIVPTTTPSTEAVKITSLNPSSGVAGSTATLTGSGFTSTGNHIMFGNPGGKHHPDGSPDNVIASESSSDGKTLTFTVPISGPSGILCDNQNHCIGIAAIKLQPGKYNVSVSNQNGTSNIVVFTLK